MEVGDIVTITDCSSNASSLQLDFGDGTFNNTAGAVTTHTYSSAGIYNISLTASKDTMHNSVQHPVVVKVNRSGAYTGGDTTYNSTGTTVMNTNPYTVVTLSINGNTVSSTANNADLAFTNGTINNNLITWDVTRGNYRYVGTGALSNAGTQIKLQIILNIYASGTLSEVVHYQGTK